MLWKKFKNLKVGGKIVVAIIAIILFPITLLLFTAELLMKSIKNKKIIGTIISGVLSLFLLFINYTLIYTLFTPASPEVTQANKQAEEKVQPAQTKEENIKDKDTKKTENTKSEKLSTSPKIYNSIDELEKAYNKNLNKIMDKKQVQKLDKDNITAEDVIKIAADSENLLKNATSDTKKIDLSGHLVDVDDLSHNTTTDVMDKVYDYLVSEYKNNKLEDKDKFYEYIYLTRYLDKSLSDSDNRADIVLDMYQIVKDNYRGLSVEKNEEQVNKALGIKTQSTSTTSTNNTSTNSIIVYANGGSSRSNKYHSSPTAHGMEGAIEMTKEEAEARGYVPCGKCY